MKVLYFCAWILCLLLSVQCYGAVPPTTTQLKSERSAARIAKDAFLKKTEYKITEYSMHPCKHTSKEWCFSFQGEKHFLGPGNHWLVTVDRSTGEIKVDEGL